MKLKSELFRKVVKRPYSCLKLSYKNQNKITGMYRLNCIINKEKSPIKKGFQSK